MDDIWLELLELSGFAFAFAMLLAFAVSFDLMVCASTAWCLPETAVNRARFREFVGLIVIRCLSWGVNAVSVLGIALALRMTQPEACSAVVDDLLGEFAHAFDLGRGAGCFTAATVLPGRSVGYVAAAVAFAILLGSVVGGYLFLYRREHGPAVWGSKGVADPVLDGRWR